MTRDQLNAVVVLSSVDAENDYFEENPCDCSGTPWSMKDRNVIETNNQVEYFERKVHCKICGAERSFLFSCPVGIYDEDKSQDPRLQHYLFAHTILPDIFFQDPQGLLYVFKQDNATKRLKGLWDEVGKREVENSKERLPASELSLKALEFDAWHAIIFIMPPVKAVAEACFAACILSQGNETPRYFVYEYTFPEKIPGYGDNRETAVLCEWLAGHKRRNHQRKGDTTQEVFIQLIKEQLDEESNRTAKGYKPFAVPTWDMADDEKPFSAFNNHTDYRHHICMFAFYSIHKLIEEKKLDKNVNDINTIKAILKQEWDELAYLCDNAGYTVVAFEEINVEFIKVNAADYYLISFSQPLAPPEPCFLAFTFDSYKIYLLEKYTIRGKEALFTLLTEKDHSILGETPQSDKLSFKNALAGKYKKEISASILDQLMHYAGINKEYEDMVM